MLVELEHAWRTILHHDVVLQHDCRENRPLLSHDNATSGKQHAFHIGRQLAEQGLSKLGIAPAPIARKETGEPDWPSSTLGSIAHVRHSHDWFYSAVILLNRPLYQSVGIDIEHSHEISPTLWSYYMTPTELNLLKTISLPNRTLFAKAIWSIKEAVIKASGCIEMKQIHVSNLTYENIIKADIRIDNDSNHYLAKATQHENWILAFAYA